MLLSVVGRMGLRLPPERSVAPSHSPADLDQRDEVVDAAVDGGHDISLLRPRTQVGRP